MTIKHLYPNARPSLDFRFARDKRLDPRITFSRASTGTYFDANGVLQSAPAGVARFDHNPETGESLGLLMEGARTNSMSYSNEFNTQWTFGGTGVGVLTPNAAIAPDGTLSASKLAAESSRWLNKSTSLSGISNSVVAFNLSTGTFDSFAATPPTGYGITEAGNGWYRVHLTISNVTFSVYAKAGESSFITIQLAGSSAYIYSSYGGAGQGIYIWGVQVEAGSFPTSYIPTSGSTVTRAADVCTVTNSNIYDTDSFTIINQPFGASAGGSTLTLFDGLEPIKRATVYSTDLSQATINNLAGKTDEFWRWRVLGSSFALPNFTTDGQVTVDWGDGTIETLTTATHTFSNGSGYHDIGFRLDSGTYFRPYINDNASHDTKVVALGPAPESMKLNGDRAFWGCSNLEAFDATVDATGGTSFIYAWRGCSSLTSFPLIDTAAGTNFGEAWNGCSSLTSFPLINTAAGINFGVAWQTCTSLTSFPLINTAAGTNFQQAWAGCSSLTDFPLINTAAGTNFINAWAGCSSLTSFPLINTAAGTDFRFAWYNCNSLTSFPEINTAAGTKFDSAWYACTSLTSFPEINTAAGTIFVNTWNGCSSLTSFPLINTAAGTNFSSAWFGCSSLTSFPLINTAAGTNFANAWNGCTSLTSFPLINTAAGTDFRFAWQNCISLTSFPANFFDSWTGPGNSCFVGAWDNCSALTATSVENILNSIDTSGQSAPASGVDITIDYNAGTGTPSVATAITNLKSRGWTITLNGVLQ